MKSLVRTIIVLVVLNLTMGSLAFAEQSKEDVPEPITETVGPATNVPPVPAPPEPTRPEPPGVSPPTLPSPAPRTTAGRTRSRFVVAGMLATSGRGKVLVIPSAEVKAEDLAAIMEDMRVMSHIFEKRFKGVRQIGGVFDDYGDFFGRDSCDTEAIYIQGYGALFLMEGNFPLSPPPESQEAQAEKADEPVDTTWEEAKQEIFSPSDSRRRLKSRSPQEYDAEKVEELKRELIRTLKHAANIRSLKPEEWIILTVVGGAQQPGSAVSYKLRQEYGRQFPQNVQPGAAGGGYAAVEGYAGSYGMAGYGYGVGGYGMGGFGAMGYPSATVLTIRAKKSDVDAYANGELDFEQFQQQVKIFTY